MSPRNRAPLTERIDTIIQEKVCRTRSIKRHIEEEKLRKEMDACTFKPAINKTPDKSGVKEYCSNNQGGPSRIDNLLKWGEEKNKKLAENFLTADINNRSGKKMAIKDIEKSADRLFSSHLYYDKKRKQEQDKEFLEIPFKPQISEKSRKLVEQKKNYDSVIKEPSKDTPATKQTLESPPAKPKCAKKLAFGTLSDNNVTNPIPNQQKGNTLESQSTISSTPSKQSKNPLSSEIPILPLTKKVSEQSTSKKPIIRSQTPTKTSQVENSKNIQSTPKGKLLEKDVPKVVDEEWNLLNRNSNTKSNHKVQYHDLTYEDDEPGADQQYEKTIDLMQRMEVVITKNDIEQSLESEPFPQLNIKLNPCDKKQLEKKVVFQKIHYEPPTKKSQKISTPVRASSPSNKGPSSIQNRAQVELAKQIAKSSSLINANRSKSPKDKKRINLASTSIRDSFEQIELEVYSTIQKSLNTIENEPLNKITNTQTNLDKQATTIVQNLTTLSNQNSTKQHSSGSTAGDDRSSEIALLEGKKLYSQSTLLKMMKGLNDDLDNFVSLS